MGNIICFNRNSPAHDCIRMSNGATDVFINVLAISGSALAETEQEKRLIVWLSEKDQKVGRGTVGFDIVEMPWQKETFIAEACYGGVPEEIRNRAMPFLDMGLKSKINTFMEKFS